MPSDQVHLRALAWRLVERATLGQPVWKAERLVFQVEFVLMQKPLEERSSKRPLADMMGSFQLRAVALKYLEMPL